MFVLLFCIICSVRVFSTHEIDFPILARVALVVLAITPSSAEVERLFSKSGFAVIKKRPACMSFDLLR